jgi:DNA polymerase-1
VADLLYNKLGLTCEIKTDTGQQSVKAEALEALADKHAIVPLLLSLSRVKKQRSTYGLSMLEHISEVDGRVHTTFNMVRSARLSSKSPNVQNITAPEEPGGEGEWARGCFVAAPGNKLVSLDYAQQELRVAAMLSGDETMAASFEAGHDFHTMTAAAAHGVSPDAVTKEQRRVGKSLNFAIIFGQSEYGIARSIDSTKERAAELMATLLGRYSKFAAWRRGRVADAEVNGILWTEWGDWCFRRSVYGIGETARGKAADRIRKHWRNVAMNNPIQCIANCFCLASLTEAVRWTREERHEVKVVMTVHDSLLFECPEGLVDEVVREGRRIMLQWPSGVVKLKVDAEVGADWGRMVKVG